MLLPTGLPRRCLRVYQVKNGLQIGIIGLSVDFVGLSIGFVDLPCSLRSRSCVTSDVQPSLVYDVTRRQWVPCSWSSRMLTWTAASRLDGSAAAGGHGINAQRPHSDGGIGAAGQCTTSGCTTKTGAAFVAPYLITRACQWIITSRCRMKELIMILQTEPVWIFCLINLINWFFSINTYPECFCRWFLKKKINH